MRWLWRITLLRTLAITLGLLNALSAMTTAAFVLFARRCSAPTPTQFAVISIVAAVGGLLGGWLAGSVARRFGVGRRAARRDGRVHGGVASPSVSLSSWPVAAALLAVELFAGVLWNVVTVSLRQAIIPDELLGRVNSVYRFFGWGMIPIGSLLGGLVVTATDAVACTRGRPAAAVVDRRAGYVVVLVALRLPPVTTERIEATRAPAPLGGAVADPHPRRPDPLARGVAAGAVRLSATGRRGGSLEHRCHEAFRSRSRCSCRR